MSRGDSEFYSHKSKSHENIRNKNHHQINQINNEYPNSLSPLTTSSIDNNIDYYNIDDAFANNLKNNGNNNNKNGSSNNTSPTSQINYNYPSTPPLSSSSSPSFSRLQQLRVNQMNIMNNNNNNFNINVNNNNTNNNFNDNELNRLSPNLPPHDVYMKRSPSNSSDYDNTYARTDSLKGKGQRNGIVNASSSLSISSTLSSSSTSSSLSSASTNMTSFPSTPITPSSPYPTAPINTTSSNYFGNNNNNANNNEPAKINHKSMPAAKTNPLIQIQPHRQNTFPYYNNQNQEEHNNVAYHPPIPQTPHTPHTPQTPHTPYSPYSYAPKTPYSQHSFNTNNTNTSKNITTTTNNTATNDNNYDNYHSKKPSLNYNSHHKKTSHTNIIRDSVPRVPSFTPSTFEFTGAQDIIDKLYESYYNDDDEDHKDEDEDYEDPNHNNFNENDDNYDSNSNINDVLEVKDNIEIEKEKEDKKKTAMNTLSRNRKREAAVKEIVTTEKTYVDGLRKLVSVFLVPLREDYQKSMSRTVLLTVNKNPMATLEDITLLFGNIEQLLALHEQLLKNLEERYYNWNPKQLISDIFLQIAPFLKMYTIYLKSFPQAISTMERLNNESKEFKKYLLNCQSKPELGGLPFNSFISLPIQRIPRYRLLLEQLFNYTVESHPDYKSLKKCVEQISIIADEVNEKIRDAENQQKVLEIQTQVEGLPTNIIDPARRFIYKGDLFKVMPKKTSPSTKASYVSTKDVRVHFLFNDLLLFCIEFQGKLLYKGDINLKYARVKALEEDAADQPFCFQVIVKQNDADRRHTVRATSYDEQVKWIERINAAIYSLNNGILSNSYNSDSQRLMPIK